MSGNLANVSSQTVGNCVLHSVSHKWIPKPYCFMWSSVVNSFQWNFVSSPTKMQLLHNQILQCILHFCLTWSSNNFFVILPCESHITTKMLPNQLFIAFDDNGNLGNQGDECLSFCMCLWCLSCKHQVCQIFSVCRVHNPPLFVHHFADSPQVNLFWLTTEEHILFTLVECALYSHFTYQLLVFETNWTCSKQLW